MVNLWLIRYKFNSNRKKYPNKSKYLVNKYLTKSKKLSSKWEFLEIERVEDYFPIQNLPKILERRSSVDISPVISPK